MAELVTLSGDLGEDEFLSNLSLRRGRYLNKRLALKQYGRTLDESMSGAMDYVDWLYRPSKIRKWAAPVGGLLMAAAAIPTPATPFLLVGGAALASAGGISESMIQEDRRKKQVIATSKIEELKTKTDQSTRYMYYAGGALVLLTAYLTLK